MRTLKSPLTQKNKNSVRDYSAGNSDMIGLPGTKFRENVDKQVKAYIDKQKMKKQTKPNPAPKQVGTPRPQVKTKTEMSKVEGPMKMKVSKKTAYDVKQASNQKLKPNARKHYAENAQAAMKQKKSPAPKMKKC